MAAVCVVRDAELLIGPFLDYHLALGVEHVYVMDNGSVDGTIDRALARKANVTILRCTLPFRQWETEMKRYLVEMVGSEYDWVALLDVDEFLDWPGRSQEGPAELLRYLDRNSYSAMLTQMLDMVPRRWVADASAPFDRSQHRFYDLAAVKRLPYPLFASEHGLTVTASERLAFHVNGLRWVLFSMSRPLWLTKHALLRPDRGAYITHPHLAQDAAVADITGVLLHYHFTGDLQGRVLRALSDHRYGWSANEEYSRYAEVLASGSVEFCGATIQELESIQQLVDEGFLLEGRR